MNTDYKFVHEVNTKGTLYLEDGTEMWAQRHTLSEVDENGCIINIIDDFYTDDYDCGNIIDPKYYSCDYDWNGYSEDWMGETGGKTEEEVMEMWHNYKMKFNGGK